MKMIPKSYRSTQRAVQDVFLISKDDDEKLKAVDKLFHSGSNG